MYQSDTDILFPMRVTPHLRNLRGDAWRDLVDLVITSPDASLDQLAFSLLIIRLSSCLTCHPHSYRALRGCTLCATHTILRFRGQDADLIDMFNRLRAEVATFLKKSPTLLEALSGASTGG